MDDTLATLKDVAGEDIANKMEALGLSCASDGVETTQSNLNRQVEVYGKGYKCLVEFVEKEEEQIAEMKGDKPSGILERIPSYMTSRGGRRHPARQPPAGSTVLKCKRSFESDMVYASREDSSTGEVELAWVRRDNKKAWEAAGGSMISGAAP